MNRKLLAGIVGFGLVVGVVAARPSSSWRGFSFEPAILAGMADPKFNELQSADKLSPNPDDKPVASLVAKILASSNYNKHALDE